MSKTTFEKLGIPCKSSMCGSPEKVKTELIKGTNLV